MNTRLMCRRALGGAGLILGLLIPAPASGAAPGDPDPTFQLEHGVLPAARSPLTSLLVQSDDRILVAGAFTNWHGYARRGLVRLLPDGRLDTNYVPELNFGTSPAATPRVSSLALLHDDRLVVEAPGLLEPGAASAATTPPQEISPLRLLVDGSLDAAFATGARRTNSLPVASDWPILVVQPSGSLIVQAAGLRRLTADGWLDGNWPPGRGGGGIPGIWSAAAAQSSGALVLFGQTNASSNRRATSDHLCRLNPDGTFDATFPAWRPVTAAPRYGHGDLPVIRQILVQPDDRIILIGTFAWLSDGERFHARGSVARLNADGSLDPGFASETGFSDIYAYPDIPQWNATNARSAFTVALAPDGRLVVGGDFDHYAGVARPNLARLNPDGSLDADFVPPLAQHWITKVAVQSDGRVLVSSGGVNDLAGQAPYPGGPAIARLEGGGLHPMAPSITLQPVSQWVTLPSADPVVIRFTVGAESDLPMSFQWLHNGQWQSESATNPRLAGVRAATLEIRDVQWADAGRYECLIANAGGRTLSASVFLSVNGSASPAPDTILPTVRVTSPPGAFLRTLDGVLLARGEAADNVGLARVLARLRDAPWRVAAGVEDWNARFELVPGTNTLEFKAVDLAGNSSPVVTRTVVFVSMKGFALAINGAGTVVRPSLSPSLEVGRTYPLQAAPKPGNLFSNWLLNGVSFTNLTLAFVMTNDLDVIANFVPSPFPRLAGIYSGLILDPSRPRHENAGAFRFQLGRDGRFAGKGVLAGRAFPLQGAFDVGLRSCVPAAPGSMAPGMFNLELHGEDEPVTGTLLTTNAVTPLVGYRARTRSNGVPFDRAGHFTVLLGQNRSAAGTPASRGVATAILTANGEFRLKGRLTDASTWSAAGPVSSGGFFPLYETRSGGAGSIFGWLTIAPGSTNDVDGVLFEGRAGELCRAWPVVGSRYAAPGSRFGGWNLGEGIMVIEGGGLPAANTNRWRLDASGVFLVDEPNPHRIELSLRMASGLVDGRFVHPSNGKSVSLKGVVLPKQAFGGGFFRRATDVEAGSFYLGAPADALSPPE